MSANRSRLLVAVLAAVWCWLLAPAPGGATVVTVEQLSNDSVPDGHPQVSEPNVAWQRGEATTQEIAFFDGLDSQNLTSNEVRDFEPEISGTNVIWKRTSNDNECELLLDDGLNPAVTLDEEFDCQGDIRIAGDHVIWAGDGPLSVADIFLFSGTFPPLQLGAALREDRQPRVGDVGAVPRAVWVDNDGLWYFDGVNPEELLFDGEVEDPEMDGDEAAFAASDGDDFEVYWTDGLTVTQITDNDVDDLTPDVASGHVVWVSGDEILLWDGSTITPITADGQVDRAPRVSIAAGGVAIVAWVKDDGGDGEIWVFDGCESTALTDDTRDDDQVALDGNTVVWRSGTQDGSEVWQAVFQCDAVCGDGVFQPPLEECDDGNNLNGDTCDENCINEVCGNAILQFGEDCDDGNLENDDGCDEFCTNECGNGVFQPPLEECDDGNTSNMDSCDVNCLLIECGNDRIEGDEECDDGNTVGGDGCDASCVLECGNGLPDPGEECDDGGRDPGDGCDETCRNEVCGNGPPVQVGEECDDGNLINDDGCSATCTAEEPASKAQQNCINEMNKRGAKLVQTQNKENLSCLKNAGKEKVDKLGAPATAQDCLTNDPKGKVLKNEDKTLSGETKKCDPADLPSFAYTDGATVNAAAVTETVALMGDLFGPDLDAPLILASADKAGAKCQQELVKGSTKLVDTLYKQTNKEKKRLLAGKDDGTLALSNPVLQMQLLGYLQADAKGKIASKEREIVSKVGSKCGATDLAAAFPGCAEGSVGPLVDCANQSARCRFCRSFNAMDGLAMGCDDFDNGAIDASCP